MGSDFLALLADVQRHDFNDFIQRSKWRTKEEFLCVNCLFPVGVRIKERA